MNEVLLSAFLKMEKVKTPMPEAKYSDIIDAINKWTDGNFSWEVTSEQTYGDTVMTTVTLYVPGGAYTGRSLCKKDDLGYNHLFALVDAAKPFTSTESVVKKKNGNMSVEQINSAVQFANAKDEKNMPAETVNMDNITDDGLKDVQKDMGMNPPAQEKKKKFRPDQVKKLRQMQIDLDIKSKEEFGKYVHSWSNGKLSKKSDITPDNADSFLKYIDSLGETVG